MGTSQNVQAWIKQANTVSPQGDTDAPWPEGMDPGSENNYARSNMSAVKKLAEDTGGALVAGGTATALTVTTNQVLSLAHIANGLSLCVRTASAATGAATIAVDGLSAVNIVKNNLVAIASGDWASGAILRLTYSSTASAFIAENISAAASTPAAVASFRANKGGSTQSISSTAATQVTFGTEVFDVGSYFASNAWTPPAGTVLLTANITVLNVAADTIEVNIYKNGGSLARNMGYVTSSGSGTVTLTVSTIDQSSGSDIYTVYVQSNSDASYSVTGLAQASYFAGTVV